MDSISREMPKYQCHKKVWALKIKTIKQTTDGSGNIEITPEEDGYAPFLVDKSYVEKHKPNEGGYYVMYSDGYKSFSPADAFEDGYSLITK